MSAIVGDGVEFVELVFTKTFRAQPGDTKTEAGDDQNDYGGENEGSAVR